MKLLRVLFLLTFLLFWSTSPAIAQQETKVLWVDIRDIVGPATVDQVAGAVQEAKGRDYAAIIITLDTPGGLVD